ncbi:MAG TPA: hypothetical protein VGD78_11830 [Chthoniobacterales bacterium]
MAKRYVLLGILVAVVAGTAWTVLHRAPEPSPGPGQFSGLRTSVEHAADQALVKPEIAQQKLEFAVPKEKLETEAARLKDLAVACGGTAVATPLDESSTSLLVQLPAGAESAFLKAAKDPKVAPPSPAPVATASAPVFVEVALHSPTTP